jgi:hypothetical protein
MSGEGHQRDPTRFEGVPLGDLEINAVDWTHRAEYVRTRSARKGTREFDVEPSWATEAALDPDRVISRESSLTSIEVVGRSPSAPARQPGENGRVLKVWLVPKDHPPTGDWWGANACDANDHDRRDYAEAE